MKTNPRVLASFAFGLLALAPLPASTITDDLSAYAVGTSLRPGQTNVGTPSGGWLSPWRVTVSAGTTASAIIADGTPLGDGGNYFSTTVATSPGETAGGGGSLARAYDANAISASGAETFGISFNFRADTTPANLRYNLSDANTRGAYFDSTATWVLSAYDGYWHVGNGSADNFMSTGVAFSAGVTYNVAIRQNPATRKWSITISGDASPVALTDLNFRTASWATGGAGAPGGRWLTFSASEIVSGTSVGVTGTFSVDSIVISK
ncbi:hypothetical protein OPIT5_25830 [Opitutaceae bacterium TAV5]|nr:hypothetical protein OPIT5_25830 [Opitutaceae bacterium TAV5]